jgi:mono/diheme cytochrome c family protein
LNGHFEATRIPLKKTTAGVGLVFIAIVLVIAIFSFLRENWAADQTPGTVERLFAGWLLSGSRKTIAERPNPVPLTESSLNEGRELYEKQCAFCHGQDGKGSGGTGVQFYPPVPSLVEGNGDLTDAGIQSVITQGIRYTAMPSFSKALSEEQMWKIVLWVRHLPASASPADSSVPVEHRP